jgi:hypothetical protein
MITTGQNGFFRSRETGILKRPQADHEHVHEIVDVVDFASRGRSQLRPTKVVSCPTDAEWPSLSSASFPATGSQ